MSFKTGQEVSTTTVLLTTANHIHLLLLASFSDTRPKLAVHPQSHKLAL